MWYTPVKGDSKMKKYIVKLTKEERKGLREVVKTGKTQAYKITHARILLKVDSGNYGENYIDKEASEALSEGVRTVERLRKRFVLEGLESALGRHKRESAPPFLNGDQEAKLVSLACSQAPTGRQRWTLNLLADQMITLGYVETISASTVRKTLKKTKLNLG